MMKCQESRELFSLRLDDELELQIVRELEAHLLECHSCTREYEDLREACRRTEAYLAEFRLSRAEKQQIRENVLAKMKL